MDSWVFIFFFGVVIQYDFITQAVLTLSQILYHIRADMIIHIVNSFSQVGYSLVNRDSCEHLQIPDEKYLEGYSNSSNGNMVNST